MCTLKFACHCKILSWGRSLDYRFSHQCVDWGAYAKILVLDCDPWNKIHDCVSVVTSFCAVFVCVWEWKGCVCCTEIKPQQQLLFTQNIAVVDCVIIVSDHRWESCLLHHEVSQRQDCEGLERWPVPETGDGRYLAHIHGSWYNHHISKHDKTITFYNI